MVFLGGHVAMQSTSLEAMDRPLLMLAAGSSPPVLFLCGAIGRFWTPLLEQQSASCHVMTTEHPGFDVAGIPDWMASVGDLALDYLDVLEALNLEQVHLVGHLLGGWTAAELAIRNARPRRALTLLASARVQGETPVGEIFQWSLEALVERRVRIAASADLEMARQNRAAAAHPASDLLLHNPQLPFWLHRVDVPGLLIWSEQDQLVPFACAEPCQRRLADVRLVSFAQTGHALPHGRPMEVAQAVEDFFAAA